MISIICDFCGAKTSKEFNHKVEIKPWYNPRVAGHVYHREFDCCEECAKAIEHRLIGIENNWLWHGKDPNRRYKNWGLNINKTEAIPKANVYKAIQEIMKYEHEGFINISLARLDEILKKCEVSEDVRESDNSNNV